MVLWDIYILFFNRRAVSSLCLLFREHGTCFLDEIPLWYHFNSALLQLNVTKSRRNTHSQSTSSFYAIPVFFAATRRILWRLRTNFGRCARIKRYVIDLTSSLYSMRLTRTAVGILWSFHRFALLAVLFLVSWNPISGLILVNASLSAPSADTLTPIDAMYHTTNFGGIPKRCSRWTLDPTTSSNQN